MAATTSRWTFVHTLSIGLCLALLVRMGLGHGLDFLAPSALENRKILGFEDCFGVINSLKNCGAAHSHTLLGKHPLSKAYLHGGVLEPEELLFGRAVDTDAVLGEVLGFLWKTKSVSAACCHSLNEISDKCWALGLVLKNRLTFQLVSTFCKAYDN